MINLSFQNFIIYTGFIWGTNIVLNIFYMAKQKLGILQYDIPLDLNKSFTDNYRILGQSTTFGGLVIVLILSWIFSEHMILGYIGVIVPVTTYVGHALGSFIKRRFGIKRGGFFPFIDHGDSIIFSGIVLLAIGYITWQLALVSLLFSYVALPILCVVGFHLGLRDYPY